ncbi:hypothetical protein HOD29_00240 [archaeon]|jgi:hypothetical protein|nr:hypothetical protein [archaeon]
MGLEYVTKGSKEIGKFLGSTILGFLPEQKLLEKAIPWYESNKGVRNSAFLEALAGFALVFPGIAIHQNDALVYLGGVETIIGTLRCNNAMQDRKKDNVLVGHYALGVPYTILKNIFKKKSLAPKL